MAQYWLQIPVENAKEVVQRKIDELVTAGTLPDYAGYTVSYDADCEVVLDGNALANITNPDYYHIYFGTFVINFDQSGTTPLFIRDINNNAYSVFDWENNPPMAGHYSYIMFNNLPQGWASTKGYFFGYKFNLNPPA